MKRIIDLDRSIVLACDVGFAEFERILRETKDVRGIGAYKIGAVLGLSKGLPNVVELARKHTDKPLIYDHQKAGTDIPDTGKVFASVLKNAGINAVIFFPFAGPRTQESWTHAAREIGLDVIIGAQMTHPEFLLSDGGYIDDSAINTILLNAARDNITDYVVPGNRPDVIKRIRALLMDHGIDPVFYAPGFVAQGGKISSAAAVAGPSWHAIVGRAIYDSSDIRQAALDFVEPL